MQPADCQVRSHFPIPQIVSNCPRPAPDRLRMPEIAILPSGRFAVINGLHLDRSVVEALAAWAESRGLSIQDAIQIALCYFNDAIAERVVGNAGTDKPRNETPSRPHEPVLPVREPLHRYARPRNARIRFGSGVLAVFTA